MSLILEALKKLEREKKVPDRGFLVVAQEPWPKRSRTGLVLAFGVSLAALAAVFALRGEGTKSLSPLPPSAAPGTEAPEAPSPTPPPTRPSPREAVRSVSPPPQASPQPPTRAPLVLSAISVRDGHPIAVLNDRLVREGDVFDGVRVVRIGESEVEVEVDGRRQVVKF